MFRVLSCLGGEHDPRLVGLAVIVCFLASLAAISLFHRARATVGRARSIWTLTAGIATGSGIWATHFIAMLAYEPGVGIAYDVGLTALSLIMAAGITTIGLGIAVYGSPRWGAPVGGGIVGGGIAYMHYLGMSAVEFPGHIHWAADLVIGSIALGIVFGVAAMMVATRSDDARSTFGAAVLLALAIVSHHFTAMGAVSVVADPTRIVDGLSMAPGSLALAVAGVAVAILGMSLVGALADRHLADRAVEAALRFRGLAEATTEALVIADGGRIVDVNSSMERLVGLTAKELTGKPLGALFPLAHGGARLSAEPSEIAIVGSKGELIACDASLRIVAHRGGIRAIVSLRDLRERKIAEARIVHLAHHDPLTDLPNRAAFNARMGHILDTARRTGDAVALLCVDLDRFKEVNDVFGHLAGDALLQELAKRMSAAANGAFLARLGGDEFALVSDGPQPVTAEALALRLFACTDDAIDVDGHQLRIGLSIGVAVYPNDGADARALLLNADAALYRAKSDGRQAIRFFEADMDKRLRERRAMQHDLRQALPRNELTLHYQPLARIDGEIIGFEALARWHHPTRGLVGPSTFVPLAEESGSNIPIGEWTLREACREAASWPLPMQIAVNLSPVQFRHGDLAALVHTVLLESGLAAGRLELEVTEGVLIGDFTRAVSILRRLKALGVKIAMDDFGTGYSSLSYLQSFPFDKIKIDQAFISNLSSSSQSTAIVRAVIGLQLPVVAEGVETEEQLAFLLHEECDGIQGFLIGRPLPIDAYAKIVGREPAVPPVAVALAG
jgi:diguanylate cyclase (GGDEF)-like protein/PAS domain S-box-containing protein